MNHSPEQSPAHEPIGIASYGGCPSLPALPSAVCSIIMLCIPNLKAQTGFGWPVDTVITQVYGERDALKPGEYTSKNYPNGQNYHAGIDFGRDSATPQKPINPIADGTIAEIYGLAGQGGGVESDETVLLWDAGEDLKFQAQESTCDYTQNGVFVRIKPSAALTPTGRKKYNPTGMTVVVKHDNGKYSHYAHLSSVRKDLYERFAAWKSAGSPATSAVQVHRGDEIGLMGSSGRNTMNGYALHLHLEVKNHDGPGHDPKVKQNAGPPLQYYGYVPGHPDCYGYTDPRELIVPSQIVQSLSAVVENVAGATANIRNAPGVTYDPRYSTPTVVIATMGIGQRFFATSKVSVDDIVWYCLDLPSTNSNILTHGKTIGWVSSQVVQEVTGASRLQVNHAPIGGELVRQAASKTASPIAGVLIPICLQVETNCATFLACQELQNSQSDRFPPQRRCSSKPKLLKTFVWPRQFCFRHFMA